MEQVIINGESYIFDKTIREKKELRHSFNELCRKTFGGLDFEAWHKAGHWSDNYIPYTIIVGNMIIANASVNIINFSMEGLTKKYIQIGTVMTDKNYRIRGLSKFLINKIIDDWHDNCDSIYLFANNEVLDFYPRFGFVKAREYQQRLLVNGKNRDYRKLVMSEKADMGILLERFGMSNPYSDFAMTHNIGLLMFYCGNYFSDFIYYLEKEKVVIILEQKEKSAICYDIFGEKISSIEKILGKVVSSGFNEVTLGFHFGNEKYSVMPTEQPRKFQPSHSFENNFPQKERNQTAVAKSS